MRSILKQITAWSYSRWKDYVKCPAYAKFKHLEKRKEPDNQYTDRGHDVHTAADNYISGRGSTGKMHKDLTGFKKQMQDLRKRGALSEQEWAFDVDWNKVAWFAATAWLRIKVDAHYLEQSKVLRINQTTVTIIDFKTGKVHDDHVEQRSLYALGAMLVYPDAQNVHVEHWYLDSGETAVNDYTAADLDELKELWLKQTKVMMNDKKFPPRPGNYCRWCHYRKANGGPCVF